MAKFTGVKPGGSVGDEPAGFSAEFNVPSLKANLEIAVRHKVAKPFDLER